MLYVDPEAEREEGQVSVPGPQPTSDPQGRTEQPAKHQAEIKPPPPLSLLNFSPLSLLNLWGLFFNHLLLIRRPRLRKSRGLIVNMSRYDF